MRKNKKVIVAVSGGFDPLHPGHVRLFEKAKALGDTLVVILNNDNWLRAKKGYVFMNEKERKELIEALRVVDRVVVTGHQKNLKTPKDMSVSRELKKIKPDIFANGGDRDKKNAVDQHSPLYADIQTCKKFGIEMVFNVGHGGKIQSSSWLLSNYLKLNRRRGKK